MVKFLLFSFILNLFVLFCDTEEVNYKLFNFTILESDIMPRKSRKTTATSKISDADETVAQEEPKSKSGEKVTDETSDLKTKADNVPSKGKSRKTLKNEDNSDSKKTENIPSKTKSKSKKTTEDKTDSESGDSVSDIPEEKSKSKNTQKETKAEESKKRKRDVDEKEADKTSPKKSKKELLNKAETDIDSLVVTNTKCTSDGKPSNLKIASWNVAGLRAWVKKNGLDYIKKEQADIVCLQETKCSESKLPPEVKVKGYHTYWCSGMKEGYAGVALYTKEKPLKVKFGLGKQEYDDEGRLITAEYEKFYLLAIYVPNAGAGLKNLSKRLRWDKDLREYLKSLNEKKPVILCGDMNVSHQPIDLANPKTNTKSAGFTQEERDSMTELLESGFVDTFRHLYPEKTGAYTYWTYFQKARSRNVGWRLDYFIVSKRFVDNVCDNVIRTEVFGSDHCPIVLFANI